ncbi:hypothetical protein [Leptolyngbya ohadii]|uniref:hypothetical protein n=1 Tax=Leptolyngbya ohadii TaxID=1962290 RepID=UPI000B598691|nr:hypothetical protein [Leptolyngbya ohadii]
MRRFTAFPAAPLSRFIAQSLTAALLISVVAGGFHRAVAQEAPASPSANPAASPSNPAANPAPASDAPAAVTQLISQIDAAANQRNPQAVLRFYSPQFTHSDGLTRQTLESTLRQVWERYPNLTYQTAIDSWRQEGNGYVVETTTTITGNQTVANRPSTLTSTIRSRQQIQGNQIVQQEILSETSQVASGAKPPTLEVILPEQVTIGQSFDFDAIVQEPLENRILLGAVQDEPVSASGYLQTTPLEFEVLSAGGLFKQGRAAAVPGERWISGVIVRDDGITAVSQRMQVVRP